MVIFGYIHHNPQLYFIQIVVIITTWNLNRKSLQLKLIDNDLWWSEIDQSIDHQVDIDSYRLFN